MSSLVIEAFLIDDLNETKFGLHGISARQVVQILDSRHIVVPNRKRRRGLYLVIGKDAGGKCIAVPIEATHDSKLWRPITAWSCKESERTVLEKKER